MMKMKFGKYGPRNFPPDGADIVFINSDYLRWLLDSDWFLLNRPEEEALAVEKELEERTFNHSHFFLDKVKPKEG